MRYLIVTLALLIASCDFLENDYVEKEPEVYYELKHLPKMMSFPRQPLKVKWEQPVPNKFGQSELIALMKFSPEDYDYIVKNSKNFDIINDDNLSIEFFNKWIDKSIADKMTLIEKDGEYILKGYSRVEPNLFVRARGTPFVKGTVHPLADGYILVALNVD